MHELDNRSARQEPRQSQRYRLMGLLILLFAMFAASEATAGDGGPPIPASFFGIHVNGLTNSPSYPVRVHYGTFRVWDTSEAQWHSINRCVGYTNLECQKNPHLSSIDWTELDNVLQQVKQTGNDDGVVYTLSGVPTWASQNPDDHMCDYASQADGSCDPPVDMNADGSCSGANSTCAIWDNWVTQLARHVNSPGYSETHAHVRYWEPWNEIMRDPVIKAGGYNNGPVSSRATFTQLLRMAEDARCIIKGSGIIHNYPSTGQSTPCSDYLLVLGQTAADVDAMIVMDSTDYLPNGGLYVWENFLYCNAPPEFSAPASAHCTWGGGLNWGSQVVDIQNFHMYVPNNPPELVASWIIPNVESILDRQDRAKPLWADEGSYGRAAFNADPIWTNEYDQAAYVGRIFPILWSSGVTQFDWYGYDLSAILWDGTALTQAGVAWNTIYGWLVGSTPDATPFCTNRGTVYECPMKMSDGTPAEIVWDSQYGPGGTTSPASCATEPVICGSTPYPVPPVYSKRWIDITGHPHKLSALLSPRERTAVPIGAMPILLEGK